MVIDQNVVKDPAVISTQKKPRALHRTARIANVLQTWHGELGRTVFGCAKPMAIATPGPELQGSQAEYEKDF
jgi:hypothetical protein